MLLQCDPGSSGKRVACPSCRKVVAVPARDEAIATVEPLSRPPEEEFVTVEPIPPSHEENDILDVLPADREPSGPARLSLVFAREKGIDPQEMFDRRVADEAEATTLLTKWQQEMPEVPSAYTPSSVLPANAVMLMIAGSIVGAGAGLLAGGLVAAVGGGLVALIVYLLALVLVFGGVLFCIVPVMGGILALLTAIGTFVVEGWISAWCTTRFGQWGNNRNIRAAVLLSLLSSVTAIVLAFVLYYSLGKPLLAERGMTEHSDLIALATAVLGGVIAAFTAGFTAAEQVGAAKFCEACERYMDATTLKTLCLGGLRAMVLALAQARLDVAASLLHGPRGDDGEVKLFCCPSCSRGYLEVAAKYKAEWKEKKTKKDKEQSWLAASRELAADEVIRLRQEMTGGR